VLCYVYGTRVASWETWWLSNGSTGPSKAEALLRGIKKKVINCSSTVKASKWHHLVRGARDLRSVRPAGRGLLEKRIDGGSQADSLPILL